MQEFLLQCLLCRSTFTKECVMRFLATTHRALFLPLILIAGFSLAGCPNLGMHTKMQTITETDRLTLKESPSNFLDRATKAAPPEFRLLERNASRGVISFSKSLAPKDLLRAVTYGAQDKTYVTLTLQGTTIEMEANAQGNFGQADPAAAGLALQAFREALTKEFAPQMAQR